MLDQVDTAQHEQRAPQPIGRRVPVVPLLVLTLLVLAAAVRPQQLLSTLRSPRALLLIAGVVLLTLLLRRLLHRLPPPLATALAAAPAVVAVALLVLPTLRGTTVDEALPDLQPLAADSAAPAAEAAAAAPVRLATGPVQGIGHRGSGTASLVRLQDGATLVRFEDLSVDPGPDYRVYLVPGLDRSDPGDAISLGKLKGTSGNQNYAVTGAVPDGPVTALIWCEAFSVAIAAASLR